MLFIRTICHGEGGGFVPLILDQHGRAGGGTLGHASEAQTLSAYVARDRQAVFADVLEGLAGA
ncbi:hypothetical protein [Rothia mucilaginosa]|uniref:hypothetical protein n=1 Tax=Rothia mucilaginosa TaxID=43675 RepID=UPI00066E9CF1|nr:hypothetical protein [Rothia mucilaginosa]